MDQQFLTNIASLVIAVSPNLDAGSSMTSDRTGTDRLTQVGNGQRVGTITYTIQIEPITAVGTIEWVCFRLERQFSAPVIGTNPMPTSAEIDASGLQQMMRSNIPSWVEKFGAFPLSIETPKVVTIKCNPKRTGAGPQRDGDYHGIIFFNRTTGTVNWSVQMRYRSYG